MLLKNIMMLLTKGILCIVILNSVNAYNLPIEKCRLEDSKCLVSAFQKGIPIFFSGIPELGIEKLETLDDITFNLSGLKSTIKGARVKDLRDIKIDSVKWNTKKKHIDIEYHTDSTVKGHYTGKGKILILPIEGDGQLKIKLKNIVIKLRLNYDIVKLSDGKDHIRPRDYTFQYDVKDNAEYHMTNLFKGNKELSDTLLAFMNENWRDVTREFGRPLLENLASKIFKNVVIFMEKFAVEDIAIV